MSDCVKTINKVLYYFSTLPLLIRVSTRAVVVALYFGAGVYIRHIHEIKFCAGHNH